MARRAQTAEIEQFPEADRLTPFPHPRATTELFGHVQAQSELAEALATHRCHHAWMLTGPHGIGKATLAYHAARRALAPPDQHKTRAPNHADRADRSNHSALETDLDGTTARQVLALSHPGLLVIRRPYDLKDKRFRTVITVEEVRRLRSFLGQTAAAGGRRVVIVDALEDLNVSAANALLKSLEEPPANTLFFLICSQPGAVLATIRSRCRLLNCAPLSAAEMAAAVKCAIERADEKVDVPDDAVLARLIAQSGGSVGRTLALVRGGGEQLITALDQVFAKLPAVDWPAAHYLSDDLAKADNADKLQMFTTVLLDRLAASVRASATDQQASGTLAGAPPAVLARLAELWETTARAKADVDTLNLDRKSFVLETISALSAAWPAARR